jgi:hypothetical protein
MTANRFGPPRGAPASKLGDALEGLILGHTWDTPHRLMAFSWDGTHIRMCGNKDIPYTFNPDHLGVLIQETAAHWTERELARIVNGHQPRLYAVALLIEVHDVIAATADDTPWEQARYQRDRRERRFHQRDDAVEKRAIHAADIDGRFYCLTLTRGRPGLDQHVWNRPINQQPDPADQPEPQGAVPIYVRAVAATIAHLVWKDPLPVAPGTPGNVASLRVLDT